MCIQLHGIWHIYETLSLLVLSWFWSLSFRINIKIFFLLISSFVYQLFISFHILPYTSVSNARLVMDRFLSIMLGNYNHLNKQIQLFVFVEPLGSKTFRLWIGSCLISYPKNLIKFQTPWKFSWTIFTKMSIKPHKRIVKKLLIHHSIHKSQEHCTDSRPTKFELTQTTSENCKYRRSHIHWTHPFVDSSDSITYIEQMTVPFIVVDVLNVYACFVNETTKAKRFWVENCQFNASLIGIQERILFNCFI